MEIGWNYTKHDQRWSAVQHLSCHTIKLIDIDIVHRLAMQ